MQRRTWLALALTVLAAPRAGAQEPHLPRIDDLRALAADVARLRAPLLVLFSTAGCPYCREVRRNYLMPRLGADGSATPRLLIREVEITSDRTLIDLDGKPLTEQAFARRFGVRVVPVVAVFDSKMALLDEPLVGLDRSGFYEGYLANMLDRAHARLQR